MITTLKAAHRIKELLFAQNTMATENYIPIETLKKNLIEIWKNQNFPEILVNPNAYSWLILWGPRSKR